MTALPYAEDCNYWKTSTIAPDTWIDKTVELIEKFDGEVLSSGYGNDVSVGRAAFMVTFTFGEETYRVIWPVLPANERIAARRQAATMLFHDVKAKCIASQVLGTRVAFFQWMQLPSGQPIYQLANDELADSVPSMMRLAGAADPLAITD